MCIDTDTQTPYAIIKCYIARADGAFNYVLHMCMSRICVRENIDLTFV